jgi:RNA polymerase subunit RPABC4/transcription elongation factor Spt4
MCRIDDDYDWTLEATFREPADRDRPCEDCGRIVAAGELIVRYVGESASEDWRELVMVVFRPETSGRRYYRDGDLYELIVQNYADKEAEIEAFDALGFIVDEVNDPRTAEEPVVAYSCPQCLAAQHWLEKVCYQHALLVTQMDLEDHLHDYGADELGPDFVTMTTMCSRRWRTKDFGRLIPVVVVDRWARNAVAHAITVGLHP